MDIADFARGTSWAMEPGALEILFQGAQEFIGGKAETVQAAIATVRQEKKEKPYTIENGVAILTISGPIVRKDSFWSLWLGCISIPTILSGLKAAYEDPAVKALVLYNDSPGGTAQGLEPIADLIHMIDQEKPVVSYATGMMASADYWIGSAARSIVADSTAHVGSIGVVIVHYDYSENDRQFGLKRTYLTAGKYKALGNDAEPLSSDARTMFEDQLNHYYSLFVDSVARNRNTDSQTVLDKMADGRVFIGRQALEAGLIDSLGSLATAIDLAVSLASGKNSKLSYSVGGDSPRKEFVMGKEENAPTTVVQLAAMYPDLVAAARKEGADSVDLESVRAEACKTERERIIGLASINFGAEAGEKFKAVVEAGVSVEQFTAIMALAPKSEAAGTESSEEKNRQEMLAAIQSSGPDNPGSGTEKVNTSAGKDFMTLVNEYAAMNKTSKTEAMQAVMKDHPEAHRAYIDKCNA